MFSESAAGTYEMVAANRHGTARVAYQIASTPLRIVEQPRARASWLGSEVRFNVVARGTDLRFQWQRDGVDIPGANNAELVIANAKWSDAGRYRVVVRTETAKLESDSVRLDLSSLGSAELLLWEQRVPVGVSNLVSLLGRSATRRDGAIIRWGPSAGPIYSYEIVQPQPGGPPPEILTTNNGIALTIDGRVIPVAETALAAAIPAGLKDVVELHSDFSAAMAIHGDGTVSAWKADMQPVFEPVLPPTGLSNVVGGTIGALGGGVWTANHQLIRFHSQFTPVSMNWTVTVSNVLDGAATWSDLRLVLLDGSGLWNQPINSVRGVTDVSKGSYHDLFYFLVGEGTPWFLPVRTFRHGLMGRPMFLKARATGAMPISYQWRRDGVDLPGETNLFLAVPTEQPLEAIYECVAANSEGTNRLAIQVAVGDGVPQGLFVQKRPEQLRVLLPSEEGASSPLLLQSSTLEDWTPVEVSRTRTNGFDEFLLPLTERRRFFKSIESSTKRPNPNGFGL